MTTITKKIEPFELYASEYDAWFNKYKYVFKSEVEAIREMLPPGESHGIEVGLGTGRFSTALGVKEGIEPSQEMRNIAISRGVEVMDAVAEDLPYKDLHFDFVLMASCISYFEDIKQAFSEANRVLKKGASLVIGFVDKNGQIGKAYQEKRKNSIFYKHATFYSVSEVLKELEVAGFYKAEISQTLFGDLDEIDSVQSAKPGHGEGSFVVIKVIKK